MLLEVVLGVDNVIFISILASKLPEDQQDRARRTGLLAAGAMRVVLLLAVGWVISLKTELFEVFDLSFSGKDLILLAGGFFLIYKATKEIHSKLEGTEHHASDSHVPVGDRTGAPSRCGVLDRFSNHRSRNDALCGGDGGGGTHVGDRHALRLAFHLHIREQSPDSEDACSVVPPVDRRHAHRRGTRTEDSKGLHLFGDRIRGACRDAQHQGFEAPTGGRTGAPSSGNRS